MSSGKREIVQYEYKRKINKEPGTYLRYPVQQAKIDPARLNGIPVLTEETSPGKGAQRVETDP
jgi:hypothetical protein